MQAAQLLRARIASGELAEGEPIPSLRDIMQWWRIPMVTASKVIGDLKAERLAISIPGRGTFVAPGAAAQVTAGPPGAHESPGQPYLRE